MTNWKEYKLGDVCQFKAGSAFKPEYQGIRTGQYPFIKVSDMNLAGNEIAIRVANNWISEADRRVLKASLHPAEATVFAKIGIALTFNRRRLLVRDTIIDNNMMSAIPDTSKVDSRFLYYFLCLQDFNQIADGSALPFLSVKSLQALPIYLPPLSTQKLIAKMLTDLDAKIELNQQMNKTLEAMAQALFKEWFVDFRFPGHEKVKFVDDLPEGWRMGALGELISIESGKRPGEKSEVITDDFRVPLIGASSVMGYVKDALYKEPILIIGRVGTHGIVQRVSWPAFPSDNTLVIRSKAHEYVYQILRMIDYQSLNVGTTQPLITQTAMKNFVILIPAGQVLEKFEKCVSNLFEKTVANNCETESLIGLRDSLLPKLMAGEITA